MLRRFLTQNRNMPETRTKLPIYFFALLFTLVFYNQSIGLNLLIFEISILLFLIWQKRMTEKNQYWLAAFVLITSVFSVVNHSNWTFLIHFFLTIVWLGSLSTPELRLLPLAFTSGITSFVQAQRKGVELLVNTSKNNPKKRKKWKTIRLVLVPLIICILFIAIYSAANPKFGYYFQWVLDRLLDFLVNCWNYINLLVLLTLLLGFVFSFSLLIYTRNKANSLLDQSGQDQLLRKRSSNKTGSLLNEYRSAVLLFFGLNGLLAFLNFMDIYWVWFNFKWEGQFLKDFVHQGTYMLILSIVISIGLVIYYFRRNLNFFQRNRRLKYLTYLWLGQNALLAVSVFIRNGYYISYYALAYKRIAIVFFLSFVMILLILVAIKVARVKSNFYLIRLASWSLTCLLVISTFFHWDRLIASYNFSKKNKSFIHLNYLATLSDSALPYLDVPLNELEKLDQKQLEQFVLLNEDSFGGSGTSFYRRNYLTPASYQKIIKRRIQSFKKNWENKHWLSWNVAEYKAYIELNRR